MPAKFLQRSAVTRASSRLDFALLLIGQRLIERRLRLLQVGLGLANLLVQFGRFNFGHRLAGFDAIADIHHAALDVAVGAGQDGSFGNGLDVARQLQFALARGAAHLDHFHPRQSLLLFVAWLRMMALRF